MYSSPTLSSTIFKKKRFCVGGVNMKNIMQLADEGKLVVSGPMKKNDRSYRGIFILNVPAIEDAKSLMAADPAINGKLLDVEYYQWFGSAALPMYLPFHKKIEKTHM